jgi:uncharacterized membrane protein YeaQ/YmgE (transglycosylase-associated protein family)
MFAAEVWVPILIEIVAGALSAAFVANLVPPLSFGFWKNAVIGAIGGVVLTWLTARTPGLEQFVEETVEEAAIPGLPPDLLVGVGVAGLLGGALFVTIAGLLRNRLKS